jgi:hypothetical protein
MKLSNTNIAKFLYLGLSFILFSLLLFSCQDDSTASNKVVEMHFFHSKNCSYCHDQIRFHQVLLDRYPNLKIIEYDTADSETQEIYQRFTGKISGLPDRLSTPTTIIGDYYNLGFSSEQITGAFIEDLIQLELGRN